jgi:hypothetical protein
LAADVVHSVSETPLAAAFAACVLEGAAVVVELPWTPAEELLAVADVALELDLPLFVPDVPWFKV